MHGLANHAFGIKGGLALYHPHIEPYKQLHRVSNVGSGLVKPVHV